MGQVSRRAISCSPPGLPLSFKIGDPMKTPEINGWQRNENNKSWLISAAIAVILVVLFYRFIRFNPPLLLLVFAMLTIIIFQVVGYRPRTLSKLFSITNTEANERIPEVLEMKGLPYEVKNGRYYLIGTNLRIETKPYSHQGLAGILVKFVPYEGQNMPLIMSLTERLDESLSAR